MATSGRDRSRGVTSHQDEFAGAPRRATGGRRGLGTLLLQARREVEAESGPAPGLGVHIQEPAMAAKDRRHSGEPKSRTLTHLLGGEEGVNDLRDDIGWHPGAGVGHRDKHMAAWRSVDAHEDVVLVEFHVFRWTPHRFAVSRRVVPSKSTAAPSGLAPFHGAHRFAMRALIGLPQSFFRAARHLSQDPGEGTAPYP